LAEDAAVRTATRIVRFEDLCAAPEQTIRAVVDHCALPDAERLAARFAPVIRAPDYYVRSFSSADLALIREQTALTARRWGY